MVDESSHAANYRFPEERLAVAGSNFVGCINLKTAKSLGITVPQTLLVQNGASVSWRNEDYGISAHGGKADLIQRQANVCL